jgi:hypothetical protein
MTVATFADETSGVYLSNGGAFIGWGKSAGPLETSRAVLTLANQLSDHCQPTVEFPLPRLGYTRFYLKERGRHLHSGGQSGGPGGYRHPMALFQEANKLALQIHTLAKKEKTRPLGPSTIQ